MERKNKRQPQYARTQEKVWVFIFLFFFPLLKNIVNPLSIISAQKKNGRNKRFMKSRGRWNFGKEEFIILIGPRAESAAEVDENSTSLVSLFFLIEKKEEETAGWKVQEVIILIGKLTLFFFFLFVVDLRFFLLFSLKEELAEGLSTSRRSEKKKERNTRPCIYESANGEISTVPSLIAKYRAKHLNSF